MKRSVLLLSLTILLLCAGRWVAALIASAQANRVASVNGDTNGDGARDLSDAVYLLNWLFNGGPEPVAIAGSPDIEARLQALEAEVTQLSAASMSTSAVLEKALGSLKALSTGSEDVWDFPVHALKSTMETGGAPEVVTFSVNGAPLGQVLAFRLDEGVSSPPRLDIVTEVPRASYKPVQPDSPLKLVYQDGTGELLFQGETSEVSLAGLDKGNVYVRITGYSKLHRLTRGRSSRIFQGPSDPDIIKRILTQAGIADNELVFLLETEFPSRDYVVQYNETDFDFVSRLMEEEGIYYFIVHSADGATIRFGNGSQARVPPSGKPLTYPGHLVEPSPGSGAYISALHRTSSVVPGKVTVGDYDLMSASAVFGSASSAVASREDYHFGVNLFTAPRLNELAHNELDLLQGESDVVAGASNAASLRAGAVIEIQGTDARFNGKYYIVGAKHHYVHTAGSGGGYYENTFKGMPEAARFLPPRVTPKPAIPGTQSAVVTGPPGETVYTDALGRVKVKFYWDRAGKSDESSSAWVRVARPGVGSPAPGYVLPQIGDEVLVAFEHGDINRPVVIGALWNGKDRPPR